MAEMTKEKLQQENKQLKKELQAAKNTALATMAINANMGKVINAIEKCYTATDVEKIAELLFNYTNSEKLKCIAVIDTNDDSLYFSYNQAVVTDNEKKLLIKAKDKSRFVDFKDITIINYPQISLLVKNMPVNDQEKYGQIKDMIPLLLGSLNEKIQSLNTATEIYIQSETLTRAFNVIEESLDRIGHSLSDNARGTTLVLSAMLQDLSFTLPSLALEEDQEEFILNKIEHAVYSASDLANASEHITNDFDIILTKLHEFIVEQEALLNSLEPKVAIEVESEVTTGIELF